MPGDRYLQIILDKLNGVTVKGVEDMERMLVAIRMIERLKQDVVEHRTPEDGDDATE